jgi:hypothetical protein
MRGLNGPSRGRFFIAKGGRACGRLMFPRPRTKKDSRPSSQSQKCLRREKETKLYMDGDGGEETHKCGERRSRTVHNWHAAGGFHCPPPLPLCMQRRIYVYGSRKGRPLLPLAVTTTVVVVVVAFSPFVCLRLDFIWCPFLFKKRRC